ncbi:hypothetical protein AK88_00829 [Plasmodium fragile]|uniref:Schizont-infected cell agglutination C-terminal domain-containing protein n=1 Tax=Plasmodium fragile TaxID=5857 RepID=A0A0D9QRS4_PLAFR|nr:uncharacterized protein AK88_00829 [Plasmodium fragile]KJP89618.1 hypothetical protein AK88_00829 [Plasmodium fragile]
MVTPPASTSGRGRSPRVHKRTIIELHLEVLHECEAAEWQNVKDDYLQILVQEFMGGHKGHSSSLDARSTNQALSRNNVPSTESDGIDRCPPNEDNPDACSCMETTQLETDRAPPKEDNPDPWNCMENIKLDAEHNEDNGVSGQRTLGARGNIPSVEMKKDAWTKWVAQPHALMHIYGEEQWFQHLLNNVQEATATHKGEVPIADKGIAVEQVMATEDSVRDLPRSQPLHPQPYMKKPLTAKLWMLLLASVIHGCEIENIMQDRELYLDELLDTL